MKTMLPAVLLTSFLSLPVQGEPAISFRRHVAPVLLSSCHACHNETTTEGGYSVATYHAVTRPGDSSLQPIVPHNSKKSELYRRLTCDSPDERMPAESDPLPQDSIQLIRRWIDDGARFDGESKTANLASILPIAHHPKAPLAYTFPVPVTAVAFANDGLFLGGYHEILRWDLSSRRITLRVGQVGERIYALRFQPARNRLYIASGSPGKLGEVRVVDATTGTLLAVPLATSEVIHDIALQPQGKFLAAAGGDRKLYIIELRTHRVVKQYDSHSDWVRAVAWNEQGNRLATASRDKTAKVFSLDKANPIATYGGHGNDVRDICFVPANAREIVSCDAEGGIHIWNVESTSKAKKKLSTAMHAAFQLLPDSNGVWVSGKKYTKKFSWDNGDELASHGPLNAWGISLARSDTHLVIGDSSGNLHVGDAKTSKLLFEFPGLPTE